MLNVWRAVKKAPYSVLMGIVVAVAAVTLLVWNEGNAVRTAQSLAEGYDLVLSVSSNDAILEKNEGKVIHVYGLLSTSPTLVDPLYNVEIEAVKLKRRVQMYQWVEEAETTVSFESDPMSPNREPSSDVSYSYSMEWKDKVVDSSSFNIPFGHENPGSLDVKSQIKTAKTVKIGHFFLSDKIVDTFTSFDPFSSDEEPPAPDTKLHGGMYYHCRDIFNPKVGDIRVQFYFAGHAGDTYSIIGIQKGHKLLPYTSSSGQEIVLLQSGQKSPEEMFATHHAHTRLTNWGLRMLGFFFLCVSITLMNNIPYIFVSNFSVLRDLRAMSGGHFIVTVSMSISLIVISLSWCVYRPVYAIILFTLSLLPAFKGGRNQRRL